MIYLFDTLMEMTNVVAMNNIYLYPDTKYAGDTNEFFTEPHCANTAVWIIKLIIILQGKHETYGWGEVYRNNTCVIKNSDILWFNGVTEETMVELVCCEKRQS